MFQWYKQSKVCYAYLADVKPTQEENMYDRGSSFRASRWFRRGWTLQDLVAPRDVHFFEGDWIFLEIKSVDLNFTYLPSTITGIQAEILMGESEPSDLSVACRMSWAARRQTTRVEDMAYCLIGIFDVNIPLLYGEGKKAFIRLQETILAKDDDHSIFAWYDDNAKVGELTGLLAESPKLFESVKNMDLDVPNDTRFTGIPSAVTAWGCKCSSSVIFHPRIYLAASIIRKLVGLYPFLFCLFCIPEPPPSESRPFGKRMLANLKQYSATELSLYSCEPRRAHDPPSCPQLRDIKAVWAGRGASGMSKAPLWRRKPLRETPPLGQLLPCAYIRQVDAAGRGSGSLCEAEFFI